MTHAISFFIYTLSNTYIYFLQKKIESLWARNVCRIFLNVRRACSCIAVLGSSVFYQHSYYIPVSRHPLPRNCLKHCVSILFLESVFSVVRYAGCIKSHGLIPQWTSTLLCPDVVQYSKDSSLLWTSTLLCTDVVHYPKDSSLQWTSTLLCPDVVHYPKVSSLQWTITLLCPDVQFVQCT
jgi:hypothetical protein